MLNPPNSLTILRGPLALLFIIDNTMLRVSIIILAMLTDSIDGYLARRYRYTSKFGAILDPIMDKFFVYVVLGVLLVEDKISIPHASLMLSRDFFLFLFITYLGITGTWRVLEIKSIRWGKVTTASQFCILLAIVLSIPIPGYLYLLFVIFGCLAFSELINFSKRTE